MSGVGLCQIEVEESIVGLFSVSIRGKVKGMIRGG